MTIPKPEPSDWLRSNATELRATDRDVLAMLRDAYREVNRILRQMEAEDSSLISAGVRRARLEKTRALLLAEQAKIFERLGDIASARRLRAAARAQRLSAAANASLLALVGKSAQAQFLYDAALQTSQRAIDVAMARMGLSEVPLSERIYRTSVWMGGRLSKLINQTLVAGLNAREFAREARNWFNPNTPGGVRYAAMRLARTEINNAFHAMSAQKAAETPWVTEVDWQLSKSHPKPDVCDKVAKESPYPSNDAPARPHPQCMCYITPKSIDEDEFVENFLAGEYDEYLDGELEKNGWDVKDDVPPAVPADIASFIKVRTRNTGVTEHTAADVARRFDITQQQATQYIAATQAGNVKPEVVERHPIANRPKPESKTIPTPPLPSPPAASSEELLQKIVTVEGDGREEILEELRVQAGLTPNYVKELSRISKMTKEERRDFEARFGDDALGGYTSESRSIAISPQVFTSGYERQFNKEVVSGFLSKCRHGNVHDGLKSFIAHEYGHHVEEMLRTGGPSVMKPIVRAAAKALGLKPPFFYDKVSLDRWVLKNKSIISKKISGYGAESSGEMWAEIWAEFSTNPNARPHVKAIGEAIHQATK